MPTYDYECQACGHRFEAFQSMASKALRKCPECKKQKLARLIGAGAGLIFKGSGFYATDNRSAAYTSDKKAAEAPPPAASCGKDQNTGACSKPGCANTPGPNTPGNTPRPNTPGANTPGANNPGANNPG